ncbi:ATP-dependent DNA helicase Rep [Sinobacterium norvegicum]|uniref:ATP-dependent DNA helicase Rep n=1 Tax=Sinobacterium norvegicum TaxID=1641715 RepID=A0ABN8EHB6_9GAMM|nr:DNA helicase Rep [Sinobacterium norvegicum]CAH0991790.1 ATP-dependent DNA helicase Rep [Sinobacterium norvegicum]
MSKLNPRQAEAVKYIDGPLLVLAGAGSGKTSVITRKIAYLIEQCGYKAHNIAALTFTNKAAREMKERVTSLVKGKASHGLTVSTFHNLGMKIIGKEHKAIGYKKNFSIFDQSDALGIIKELILQNNAEGDVDLADNYQQTISNWKNELIMPGKAISYAKDDTELAAAMIYEGYQRLLQAYNAVDFDDLIMVPTLLFQEQPDVLARWQRKIRYLLVDEYQDTNGAQYHLVKQLVGDNGKLTVVGDDDQSIYAWRGARPENLFQLREDYPHLKLVKLEQNYRSTARILKAANTVIANNPHVFEKALWSELGFGDQLRIIQCRNEESELDRVAAEILDQRLRHRRAFKDFAILYRGNHQSRLLELKLQQQQIPYQLSGGTSFFSRQEIKDIMAYLKLLINPDDDNSFLRIVNVPRRKIGASTLEALGRYANKEHISMFAAAQSPYQIPDLNEASIKRLEGFSRWLVSVRENAERNNPIEAINEMIADIDYEAWLHQNVSSAKAAEKRMENIRYLIDSLANSLTKIEEDNDGESDIGAAITKLILRDMMERQADEEDADQVQLMTLHASKGLEFPHVFIIGCEEEILPHRASIEEDNIEEERRLAYVGITRAKQTLTMTWCTKRKQFGEVIDCIPSRFLDELPQEDVVWEGGESDPEANRKKGKETMASLKSLLDDF